MRTMYASTRRLAALVAFQPTELLWFHFSGGESAAYVRLLTSEGICFDGNHEILQYFEQIFHYGDKQVYNEHRISVCIQSVLCCLAVPDTKPDIPEVIRPAVEYIAEHFREEVTLEMLADLCHVSVTVRGRTSSVPGRKEMS